MRADTNSTSITCSLNSDTRELSRNKSITAFGEALIKPGTKERHENKSLSVIKNLISVKICCHD
jgi:hypothetical protein